MFKTGPVVLALKANERLNKDDVEACLKRHKSGDFGHVAQDSIEINNEAIKDGNESILSAYRDKNGIEFWILTEWNRSVTTVLLPEEY